MDASSDQATSICAHCDRAIPSSNIELHDVHCFRNLEKCKVCGDMVPKKHADKHFKKTHALVPCPLCKQKLERGSLDNHKRDICPQRMASCDFCEFPLPAVDLREHQETCGNRTELCHLCNKYIRLREIIDHETRCPNEEPSTSRDVERVHESGSGSGSGGGGGGKKKPDEFPRVLFSIAVTGIAVILGSIFIKRNHTTTRAAEN